MEGFINRTPQGRTATDLAFRHLGVNRTDVQGLFSFEDD